MQKRKASKNQGSSSKRVRFNEENPTAAPVTDEFEFDHEAELETAKRRRGAVNLDGYGSSEDESDDSEPTDKKDDDDLDDMFADAKPESSKAAGDKKKKTRFLSMNEIEGQELSSRGHDSDSEGEPKIMAFNMKEDLEEGEFDEEGNYIRNKVDPNAFHDKWLQGLSKKDIAKAKAAQEKQEQTEQLKEADVLSSVPQDKTGVFRALIDLLQPGENVRDALVRLGGSAKKIPAWKAKKMQQKNGAAGEPTAEDIEKLAIIDRITALADQMMALGDFGIYDETYEAILRHLRRSGTVPLEWMPGQTKAVTWEYRWAGSGDAGEVYGPFSSTQMQEWQAQGFFTNGIEAKKVGSEDAFTAVSENFSYAS